MLQMCSFVIDRQPALMDIVTEALCHDKSIIFATNSIPIYTVPTSMTLPNNRTANEYFTQENKEHVNNI